MKRLFALALVALLAACGKKEAPPPEPQPQPAAVIASDFTVLATTDLRDVQPLEEMVMKATLLTMVGSG